MGINQPDSHQSLDAGFQEKKVDFRPDAGMKPENGPANPATETQKAKEAGDKMATKWRVRIETKADELSRKITQNWAKAEKLPVTECKFEEGYGAMILKRSVNLRHTETGKPVMKAPVTSVLVADKNPDPIKVEGVTFIKVHFVSPNAPDARPGSFYVAQEFLLKDEELKKEEPLKAPIGDTRIKVESVGDKWKFSVLTKENGGEVREISPRDIRNINTPRYLEEPALEEVMNDATARLADRVANFLNKVLQGSSIKPEAIFGEKGIYADFIWPPDVLRYLVKGSVSFNDKNLSFTLHAGVGGKTVTIRPEAENNQAVAAYLAKKNEERIAAR